MPNDKCLETITATIGNCALGLVVNSYIHSVKKNHIPEIIISQQTDELNKCNEKMSYCDDEISDISDTEIQLSPTQIQLPTSSPIKIHSVTNKISTIDKSKQLFEKQSKIKSKLYKHEKSNEKSNEKINSIKTDDETILITKKKSIIGSKHLSKVTDNKLQNIDIETIIENKKQIDVIKKKSVVLDARKKQQISANMQSFLETKTDTELTIIDMRKRLAKYILDNKLLADDNKTLVKIDDKLSKYFGLTKGHYFSYDQIGDIVTSNIIDIIKK
jgi:hypothetical protein